MTFAEELAHVLFAALSDPNRRESDLEIITAILERGAMRWTTKKPTVPGWYFYRDREGFIDIMGLERYEKLDGRCWVQVVSTTITRRSMLLLRVEEIEGEWAGPLIPPDSTPLARPGEE